MGKVSAVLIVKNEEKGIGRCLEALGWADEIVVVDSGSTDRTVEICRRYTERVIFHEWPGSNQQKNFAIDCARHPWVLVVDADEIIPPELGAEIRRVVDGEPLHAGYAMRRKNLYRGRWVRRGGFWPNYEMRLFLRERGRFIERLVHDKALVEGSVGKLEGAIVHDNIQELREWVEKNVHYSYLGALQDHRAGKPVRAHYFVMPALHFLERYLLKGGFLDGVPGLIFSFLPAYYRWLTVLFRWEMQRFPEKTRANSSHPAESVDRRG